jgi:hypothetical protein
VRKHKERMINQKRLNNSDGLFSGDYSTITSNICG